jgi:hypothetical protein
VVAFVMHVRQTGPLATPLGTVPPTGREAAARTIDILAVRDGRSPTSPWSPMSWAC